MQIVKEILDLFAKQGAASYHGEAVSQEEHALQAAELAERDWAPNSLVVAALLHDIGHLLDGQDEDLADRGVDSAFEQVRDHGFGELHKPAGGARGREVPR
jgi:predicted HD phosphohydrolase